uniref:Uncharacterized protein n=1 Tax=Nelumbo nucifera TaxID=4432 RepID=A0A822YXF1_NELNU|nr:TPA_asm: hypothetical protein HUJ06_006649 [Nelumbo nucifera]
MSPATPTVVSSVQELYEFASLGPLVEKLGLTSKIIAETFHKWLKRGLYPDFISFIYRCSSGVKIKFSITSQCSRIQKISLL